MASQQKLSRKSVGWPASSVRLGRSRPRAAGLAHLVCMTHTPKPGSVPFSLCPSSRPSSASPCRPCTTCAARAAAPGGSGSAVSFGSGSARSTPGDRDPHRPGLRVRSPVCPRRVLGRGFRHRPGIHARTRRRAGDRRRHVRSREPERSSSRPNSGCGLRTALDLPAVRLRPSGTRCQLDLGTGPLPLRTRTLIQQLRDLRPLPERHYCRHRRPTLRLRHDHEYGSAPGGGRSPAPLQRSGGRGGPAGDHASRFRPSRP